MKNVDIILKVNEIYTEMWKIFVKYIEKFREFKVKLQIGTGKP